MPRAMAIFRHEVNLEIVIGDVDYFMRTDRAERRRYWEHAGEKLGLAPESGLALLRIEDGIFMHEPCTRALVFCPYRPGLNEDLKTLGPTRIRYESRYACWVVRIDDDDEATRLIRKLLKFLPGVIVQDGGEAALLSHRKHWRASA